MGSSRPGWEQERRLPAIPRGAEPKSQRDAPGRAAGFGTFLVSPQSIFFSAPTPRSAGFPPLGLKAPQRCGAAAFLLHCRSKVLPVIPRAERRWWGCTRSLCRAHRTSPQAFLIFSSSPSYLLVGNFHRDYAHAEAKKNKAIYSCAEVGGGHCATLTQPPLQWMQSGIKPFSGSVSDW